MFGRDETRGAARDRSSTPAGSTAPGHVTEARRAGLPAGFRAAGVAAGHQAVRRARRRPARVRQRRTRPAPPASPPPACWRRRCSSPRTAAGSTRLRAVAVNSGNANAATGGRGHRRGGEDAGRRGDVRRRRRGPGGDRLDRRDRRPARRGRRSSTGCSTRAGALDGRRRQLRRGDPHDGRVPQAGGARRRAAGGHGPAVAPRQGRRDDLARASPRCSASCRPTPRCSPRRPTCCSACASSAPSTASRVDGQLSTNDTVDPDARPAPAASRSRPESEDELRLGEALDALLRQLALLIARDGEGAKRVGRVVVHRRPPGRGRRAPPAPSPTRRWSRPRCTAATRTGAGSPRPSARALPGTAPLALDIWIEDVQVCGRGAALPLRRAGARPGGERARGRVHGRRCPARAPTPRSSSPISATST